MFYIAVCIARHAAMVIIETYVFTRRVLELLTDEEYRQLQIALVNRPHAGSVIPRSGGVRIVYYWAVAQERFLMLFVFAKNECDDLSPDQLQILQRIVEDEYP